MCVFFFWQFDRDGNWVCLIIIIKAIGFNLGAFALLISNFSLLSLQETLTHDMHSVCSVPNTRKERIHFVWNGWVFLLLIISYLPHCTKRKIGLAFQILKLSVAPWGRYDHKGRYPWPLYIYTLQKHPSAA